MTDSGTGSAERPDRSITDGTESAPSLTVPAPRRFLEGDLREFVVIALGVLSAFAVDAWWTGAQERQDLREELVAVEAELTESIDRLRVLADLFRLKAEAGQRLLGITGPEADAEASQDAIDLIGTVMRGDPTRASTASLDMLVTSGQLARIEDRELQAALASWPEQLMHVYDMESAVRQTWLQEARPRLVQYVPMVNIDLEVGFRDYPALREAFAREVGGPSRFDPDVVSLLRDLQFENGVHTVTTLAMIGAERADQRAVQGEGLLERLRIQIR